MNSKFFGISTILAVMFTATYFIGREVINMAWERDELAWVEPLPEAFRVIGLQAGKSTLADAMDSLTGHQFFLQRTEDGFNIEMESRRNAEDQMSMTIIVQPDTPGEQQAALFLQARASGLFSDEALAGNRVPFTTLTDAALTSLPLRKIEIVPDEPIPHERVLAAHGKPDLASPVENHEDGAEQAWIYPRKGAVIFFREYEAIRFRYFDPARLRTLKQDPEGLQL